MGDCTDYCREAVIRAGHSVPYFTTGQFRSGNAASYYELVPASDAQAGDVFIRGTHAGIVTSIDRQLGNVRVHQNGGGASPYRDGKTGNWNNPIDSGQYFRLLVPRT